jgi:D-arabinose 1-dehydrogenase-like Zn-dependent alcohol dehydrogenase
MYHIHKCFHHLIGYIIMPPIDTKTLRLHGIHFNRIEIQHAREDLVVFALKVVGFKDQISHYRFKMGKYQTDMQRLIKNKSENHNKICSHNMKSKTLYGKVMQKEIKIEETLSFIKKTKRLVRVKVAEQATTSMILKAIDNVRKKK